MSSARDNPIDRPFGHAWRVVALWTAEGCAALAAAWALAGGRDPKAMIGALGYLLLCGVALLVPAHALRAGLAGASARRRRSALQLVLALSAAAVAGSLSTGHGWAGIVFILLLGDALWALELELRADHA